MRRHVLVLAASLVLVSVAARADDAKFDLRKKAAPAAGAKTVEEGEITRKQTYTFTTPDTMPTANIVKVAVTYKALREVNEVSGDQVSKETVKFEQWKLTEEGGKKGHEDTSLSSRTVHIPGTSEANPLYTIEGDDGKEAPPAPPAEGDLTAVVPPTPLAKNWVEKGFVNAQWRAELEALLPKDPVALNGEWTLDPKEVATTLYPIYDCDLEKSSAKGKLAEITTEDGVKIAHLAIQVRMKLLKVPALQEPIKDDGTPDCGVLRRTAVVDLSLEPEKRNVLSVRFDEVLDYSVDKKLKNNTVQQVDADILKTTKISIHPPAAPGGDKK